MKKVMYLFVMMTAVSLGLVSCGGDVDEKDFVGTWEITEYDSDGDVVDKSTITFKQDGTFINDIDEVGIYSIMTTKEAIKKFGASAGLPDGEWLVIDWGGDIDSFFIKSYTTDRVVLSIHPSEPDIVFKRIK